MTEAVRLQASNSPFSQAISWLRENETINKVARFVTYYFAIVAHHIQMISIIDLPMLISRLCRWNKPTTEIWSKELLDQHDALNLPTPLLKQSPLFEPYPAWKTMAGIGIIADYLCEKNNLNNLYVCETIEAFLHQLKLIASGSEDMRQALIVPSHQPIICSAKQNCEDTSHAVPDFHAQHKVAVLIERQDGKTKICVLDSGAENPMDLSQTYLGKAGDFSCLEFIHAYLREANLPETVYYYALGRRHWTKKGACETFALRDSVAFLRDPAFFSTIEAKGMIQGNGTINNPFTVSNLPPEYMKTTQSHKRLNSYIFANDNEAGYPLHTMKLGKHQRTLMESLRKHSVVVNQKAENRHIDERIKKYQRYLVEQAKSLSSYELLDRVNRRLLT